MGAFVIRPPATVCGATFIAVFALTECAALWTGNVYLWWSRATGWNATPASLMPAAHVLVGNCATAAANA